MAGNLLFCSKKQKATFAGVFSEPGKNPSHNNGYGVSERLSLDQESETRIKKRNGIRKVYEVITDYSVLLNSPIILCFISSSIFCLVSCSIFSLMLFSISSLSIPAPSILSRDPL